MKTIIITFIAAVIVFFAVRTYVPETNMSELSDNQSNKLEIIECNEENSDIIIGIHQFNQEFDKLLDSYIEEQNLLENNE